MNFENKVTINRVGRSTPHTRMDNTQGMDLMQQQLDSINSMNNALIQREVREARELDVNKKAAARKALSDQEALDRARDAKQTRIDTDKVNARSQAKVVEFGEMVRTKPALLDMTDADILKEVGDIDTSDLVMPDVTEIGLNKHGLTMQGVLQLARIEGTKGKEIDAINQTFNSMTDDLRRGNIALTDYGANVNMMVKSLKDSGFSESVIYGGLYQNVKARVANGDIESAHMLNALNVEAPTYRALFAELANRADRVTKQATTTGNLKKERSLVEEGKPDELTAFYKENAAQFGSVKGNFNQTVKAVKNQGKNVLKAHAMDIYNAGGTTDALLFNLQDTTDSHNDVVGKVEITHTAAEAKAIVNDIAIGHIQNGNLPELGQMIAGSSHVPEVAQTAVNNLMTSISADMDMSNVNVQNDYAVLEAITNASGGQVGKFAVVDKLGLKGRAAAIYTYAMDLVATSPNGRLSLNELKTAAALVDRNRDNPTAVKQWENGLSTIQAENAREMAAIPPESRKNYETILKRYRTFSDAETAHKNAFAQATQNNLTYDDSVHVYDGKKLVQGIKTRLSNETQGLSSDSIMETLLADALGHNIKQTGDANKVTDSVNGSEPFSAADIDDLAVTYDSTTGLTMVSSVSGVNPIVKTYTQAELWFAPSSLDTF